MTEFGIADERIIYGASLNMSDSKASDWSNYWQGRAGTETGAALAGAGVENMESLNNFWGETFSNADKTSRVLDLACGAGSAIKHADANGIQNLTGADISEGALSALQTKVPAAKCVLCSADETPFGDGSFDFVVSQFGFEYADYLKAGAEVARLLAPNGKFIAVSHYQGGAIEVEVSLNMRCAQKIIDSQFIEASTQIITDLFEQKTIKPVHQSAFERAQPLLISAIKEDPTGLGQHLYQGFQQLYQRRQAYKLSDITGWLSGMEHEVQAYIGRMQSMKDAALDKEAVEVLMQVFKEHGCETETPEPFLLREDEAPGAWVLKASKPA